MTPLSRRAPCRFGTLAARYGSAELFSGALARGASRSAPLAARRRARRASAASQRQARAVVGAAGLPPREAHADAGAAVAAVLHVEAAAVRLGDLAAQREPHAAAVRL